MSSTSITTSNSTIVSAFQTTLIHQLLIVLVICAVLAVAWNIMRGAQLRRAIAQSQTERFATAPPARSTEPLARRILRVGFGLLWLLDGLLQAQSAMPIGLASQVTIPAAATSPSWVRHLVNSGATIWNNHPIEAAASSVWIQVGIGLWLLVAQRGRWSQTAALVSVAWGLLVWVFGEAFGQIFAPGLTWLFGAPGAVLFYSLAGLLVALPERAWLTPRIGRALLRLMGLFFFAMALLQAWPGRGYWQGAVKGHAAGPLVGMVQDMSSTPQPAVLATWVRAFASFDSAHGFAVNMFVVVALSTIGLGLFSARRNVAKVAMLAGCLLCLADWILIEDFGFFGGLGTDPNSMIPMALLFVAGYFGVARVGAPAEEIEGAEVAEVSWLSKARLDPSYAISTLAAMGAALIVLLGAAPMALASTNPNADPIVTEAVNGTPDVTNVVAPGFTLTDQVGRSVSLASLKGKAVVLTFLDPVCTTDCPIIGQELRLADQLLGASSKNAEFVAVNSNPVYRSTFYTATFDVSEGLNRLSNWLYLTGSAGSLSQVWSNYGVEVAILPAGAMIDHSDIAYVIDAHGHTRFILSANPGPTTTTHSSFVSLLDDELRKVMASP